MRDQFADFRLVDQPLTPERIKVEPVGRSRAGVILQTISISLHPFLDLRTPSISLEHNLIGKVFEKDFVAVAAAIQTKKQNHRAMRHCGQKDWAGRKFADLTAAQQDVIRQYSFNCEVFQAVSDKEILDIFARLNSYSVPLNKQELRNGRFFGYFKRTAYELAHDYLEFWRKNGIFSERSIARMLEVELTSELMIAELHGLQDKKKSIDTFYEDYDKRFAQQRKVEARFSATIDVIGEALGDALESSEFARVPLFYSLFCAVYHRTYGLPGLDVGTPKRPLTTGERGQLASAIAKLSELISNAKDEQDIPNSYVKFVTACLGQTDNLEPRRIRLLTLYGEAF